MQDTRIDELELSVKTFSGLLEAGNLTLGDLVINTKELLREQVGARGEREVRVLLTSHGLRLADDQGVDVGADEAAPKAPTWGALFAWMPGKGMEDALAALDAAYAEVGLEPTEPSDAPAGEPWLRSGGALVEDEVWVVEQEAEGWFALMCSKLEWCAPGAHPLARALSRGGLDVVSLTSASGAYVEVTRYEGGAPAQWRIVGKKVAHANGSWEDEAKEYARIDVVALDPAWFVARGALGAPAELFEALQECDLDGFGAMTGCESVGFARQEAGEGVRRRYAREV